MLEHEYGQTFLSFLTLLFPFWGWGGGAFVRAMAARFLELDSLGLSDSTSEPDLS